MFFHYRSEKIFVDKIYHFRHCLHVKYITMRLFLFHLIVFLHSNCLFSEKNYIMHDEKFVQGSHQEL